MTPSVLFVCVSNGGKSQLAAALMHATAGDRVTVASAGTQPGQTLNALSVQSLQELGIDIADRTPRAVTPDMLRRANVVIILGREAQLAPVTGTRLERWNTDEPSERGIEGLERMRMIRDDIAAHVDTLRTQLLPD